MGHFLTFAWFAFLLLYIGGTKTFIPTLIMLGLSASVFLAKASSTSLQDAAWGLDRALQKRIGWGLVISFIALTFAADVTALWLDHQIFNGTLWDLTQYIQESFNLAAKGSPEATFPGHLINHGNTHRSLSIYAIGLLFRIFDSPFVVLLWQGVFHYAPGLIAMVGLHRIGTRRQEHFPAYAYLLAFLTYAASPAVLRQETWPYAFYMGGFSLIALAYLFLWEQRWMAWFFTAALLAFEKEDFGVVSAGFGILVFIETMWTPKKERPLPWQAKLPAILGLGLIIIGVLSLVLFHKNHAGIVTFESRYRALGRTPLEALHTLVTQPWIPLRLLFEPDAIAYWFFFLCTSLLWLMPRWSAIRYFVPILPILGANLIATYAVMRNLKDPYCLPIATGVSATILFGVFATSLQRRSREIALLTLTFASLLPSLWPSQTPFRTVHELFPVWRKTAEDRAAVEDLRLDRSKVICCEERTCSYFADRPLVIEDRFCTTGTTLLNGVKEVVFVKFAMSKHQPPPRTLLAHSKGSPQDSFVTYPESWPFGGHRIRFSAPTPVLQNP